MNRYIDTDKLKARLNASPAFQNMGQDGFFLKEVVLNILDGQPTADVVEVVHAKWELEHKTYGKMRCSHCKHNCQTERKPDPYEDYQMTDFYVESPFCPNCGARMDGERSDKQ